MRRTRAFAIIDYMCGTVLLLSALATVTSLNLAKFRTFTSARQRQRALYTANNALERALLRFDDLSAKAGLIAQLEAAPSWVPLASPDCEVDKGQVGADAKVTLEARRLPETLGYIELRVRVSWHISVQNESSLELATLIRGGE